MTNITAAKVKEVMTSSVGSEIFYKRMGLQGMDYTEGVMNFQKELNAFWFVDMMYSHIKSVLKDFQKVQEYFYVVTLDIKDDHTARFEIKREVYNENNDTDEIQYKVIAEQDIEYTDLPACEIKFFLELANLEPVTFRLLCPSEH